MCIRSLLGQVINTKHVQNKTLLPPLISTSASHKRTKQMETFPRFHGVWITKIQDDKVLLLVVKKALHEKQGLVDS